MGSLVQRAWAAQLKSAGIQGALAAMDKSCSHECLYASYYLDLPFAGAVDESEVQGQDAGRVEQALERVGVQTLLVPADDKWKWFRNNTTWKQKLTLKDTTHTFLVYVSLD